MIELLNCSTADSAEREKAIRLVEYLTRIAQLQTKVVRNVDEYHSVLWVNDVPCQKGCFTQAWGRDENYDSDVWVEIQRPVEPELPTIPDVCKVWINPQSLRNKSNIPELQEEITEQTDNPNWVEDSDQPKSISHTKYLEDFPEVQKTWDAYVEDKWLYWVADHDTWESIYKVYSQLFAIRQEQTRLGEDYELVLGLGLLIWRSPSGQHIRRHLFVADADVTFVEESGEFVLKPHAEGAKLRPELDMLDADERPLNAEKLAKDGLEDVDNPWEKSIVDGVLKALVHSFDTQGAYNDSLDANDVPFRDNPVVICAPALILRKRSAKGLTDVLQKIREKIEMGEGIPSEFLDLAEIQLGDNENAGSSPPVEPTTFDSEVFFPKPSNKEQRLIVDKIRLTNGVLVQGPPGTGKSHTIANLICHLLATGQRILITAKTPRALRSLEKHVPEELRALWINLINSGLGKGSSLESSIRGIYRARDNWNVDKSNRDREKLEKNLRRLRAEKAEIDHRLRDIRESETYSKSISAGRYIGTAAKIAEAVNRDRNHYEWFTDDVREDRSCPISEDDTRKILRGLRHFTPQIRQELNLDLPYNLPSSTRWRNLIENEVNAARDERSVANGADERVAAELSRSNSDFIESLRDALKTFLDKRFELMELDQPWIKKALRESIAGHSASWRDLLHATRNVVTEIDQGVEVADNTAIDNPKEINLNSLHQAATKLLLHLENGGKFRWYCILPKPIRVHRRLIKKILVNGRRASTLQDFRDLEMALRVRRKCETAWELWAGYADNLQGPYLRQMRELKALSDSLEDALSLEELTKRCRELIGQCAATNGPFWSNESQFETIVSSCHLALARQRKRDCENEIRTIENPVLSLANRNSAHPVAIELLHAIRDRDVDDFVRAANKIRDLRTEQERVQKLGNQVLAMRQHLPRLMDDLERTCNNPCWDRRADRVQDAWRWAYARYWVEDFISQGDVPALAKRVKQIEDEINSTIATLAALHAWSFCFSRLTENHRRHMEAWRKSMQSYGKGTGKHAAYHLRQAQHHLKQCYEAVPAWIMPLHSVWDTVDPAPGMFDVIIVDEASQCGIEAMPLFYLGKKILIVGDDKQISPESVGLLRDAVHRLIDEFLYDYDFKAAFNVESSIFDHGKLRYGAQHITLREHFRCMPEIIRFSNDLCYSDTPLIPLRQYGPDRLVPLERVYVSGGYREGSGNGVINRPEADAVVEKIVELCNDCTERYDDKSMGVVVLQGEAQARLIEEQLLKQLGAEEMERRRLVCGNPYHFQGDERHIMFLSLVAAANERIGPLTKDADERRFNVAASRAKNQMFLFHSVKREDLSPVCLRRRLLEFFDNTKLDSNCGIDLDELELMAREKNRHIVKPRVPFDSWFEVDVALDIARRGFNIIPQYGVAGWHIDLVIESGNARLAVECDGDAWHGPDEYENDMFRQRQLERCGWEFFRVRQSAFYLNRERALERLWRTLEERGIFPISH